MAATHIRRPIVSFIMPVWQPQTDWLHTAVRSVLDDIGIDVELIVVDDGNDEPTADLLREFADDPRVRSLRVPHGGPAAARNAGLAAATGEYVRFVDADDAVAPGGTSALLRALRWNRRSIAHGAVALCNERLQVDEVRRETDRGEAWMACLTGGFAVYHPALLFPRDVLLEIGGWADRATCEDWDLVLRALEIAPVEPCHDVVYLYRRWPGSLSKTTSVAQDAGERVVRDHFARHPAHRGTKIEQRAEAYLTQRAQHRFGAGSPWLSPAWWNAARTNPYYPARVVRDALWRKAHRARRGAVRRLGQRNRVPSRTTA